MDRTITVKGTGHVTLVPDTAEISLTLRAVDKNYDKAAARAAELLKNLQASLGAAGFAPEELKTACCDISTEYESVEDEKSRWRQVFSGYACSQNLKLELAFDNARLAAALGAITGSIAEPQLNLRFTVKDQKAAADLLLKKAAANARRQAEILAEASGAALGSIVRIDYSWDDLYIRSATECRVACDTSLKACGLPDLTPEDIDLTDSAVFVWELV